MSWSENPHVRQAGYAVVEMPFKQRSREGWWHGRRGAGGAGCGVRGSYVVRLVGRGGRGRAGSQKGGQAWGGASGQCSEA